MDVWMIVLSCGDVLGVFLDWLCDLPFRINPITMAGDSIKASAAIMNPECSTLISLRKELAVMNVTALIDPNEAARAAESSGPKRRLRMGKP